MKDGGQWWKGHEVGPGQIFDMYPLSTASRFNVAVQRVRKGSNNSFGGLLDTWTENWPLLNEVEIPKQLWYIIEKAMQG